MKQNSNSDLLMYSVLPAGDKVIDFFIDFLQNYITNFTASSPLKYAVDIRKCSLTTEIIYEAIKGNIPDDPLHIPRLIFIDSEPEQDWLNLSDIYLSLETEKELEVEIVLAIKAKKQVILAESNPLNELVEDILTYTSNTQSLIETLEQLLSGKRHPLTSSEYLEQQLNASQLILCLLSDGHQLIKHSNQQITGLGLKQNDPDWVTQLLSVISQLNIQETIGLFGQKGSAHELSSCLERSGIEFVSFDQFSESLDSKYRLNAHIPEEALSLPLMIIGGGSDNYRSLVNELRTKWGYKGHLLLPFLNANSVSTTPEKRVPTVLLAYPCAGTGRFAPVILNILLQTGHCIGNYKLLSQAPYILQQKFDQLNFPSKEFQEALEEFQSIQLGVLDYHEILNVHDELFHSKICSKFPEFKFVALIRDPRDLLISFYYYHFGSRDFDDIEQNKEQRLVHLMEYGINHRYTHTYNIWPSIDYITDHFINTLDKANIFIVRFEDLYHREFEIYQQLVQWLELDNDCFNPPLNDLIQESLQLGSFKVQSRGRFNRGESHQRRLGVKGIGQSSMRKGVPGDWKNHFTPSLKECFKQLTGNALIRLGYENSMNW